MKTFMDTTPTQQLHSYFYCKLLVTTHLILPIMMVRHDEQQDDIATASDIIATTMLLAALAIFRYVAFFCITSIRLSALYHQCRLYCNSISSQGHRKFFRRKFNEPHLRSVALMAEI